METAGSLVSMEASGTLRVRGVVIGMLFWGTTSPDGDFVQTLFLLLLCDFCEDLDFLVVLDLPVVPELLDEVEFTDGIIKDIYIYIVLLKLVLF